MLLCELDGRVLRGMQFGVLVDAVWGAGGCCFASLMGCRWMLFCELDGRVLGGMQFGVLVEGHAVWGAGGCCSRVTVRGWCVVMMFPTTS